MRCRKAIRHLYGRRAPREYPAGHAATFPQRGAFDELRHDVRRSVLRADVIDGMSSGDSARSRLELIEEASLPQGIAARARQHFDRNRTAQTRVAPSIDLAHAAGAEHGDDFIRAKTIGRGGGQWAARQQAVTVRLSRWRINWLESR